jgi:hypothetical protein
MAIITTAKSSGRAQLHQCVSCCTSRKNSTLIVLVICATIYVGFSFTDPIFDFDGSERSNIGGIGTSLPTVPDSKFVLEDPLWSPFADGSSLLEADDVDYEWKKTLFQRLDRIRLICGSLCANAKSEASWLDNSRAVPGANLRFTIARDINCSALMDSEDIDAGDTTVKFPVPLELMKYYSVDNAINVVNKKRHRNVYLGGKALVNVWTEEDVENQIAEAKAGTLKGSYSSDVIEYVRGKLHEMDLSGKRVMVIGSERPWVEAILLSRGASHVTTLEYGVITSEHPKISTLTPADMRKAYRDGTLEPFDAVVTHSSIEHSGLGRYGDALNPWGDMLAIARAWCVTKPDAALYIGVPAGEDRIEFNAHRIFGRIRLSLLSTNWVQTDGDKHKDTEFLKGRAMHKGVLFRKVVDFDLEKKEYSSLNVVD